MRRPPSTSPPTASRARCSAPSRSPSRCCCSRSSARRPIRAIPIPIRVASRCPSRARLRSRTPSSPAAVRRLPISMHSSTSPACIPRPPSFPTTAIPTPGPRRSATTSSAPCTPRPRDGRRDGAGRTSATTSSSRRASSRRCRQGRGSTTDRATATSCTITWTASSGLAACTTAHSPSRAAPRFRDTGSRARPGASACASTRTCRCRITRACGPSTVPSRPNC
ncbi:hypothetical protein D9M70_294330 [compost metagenome]